MTLTSALIKIGILATLAFAVAMAWTPLLSHVLFKYRLGKSIRSAKEAPIMAKMHAAKKGTPTMGGVLVWVTAAGLAIFLGALGAWLGGSFAALSFLTRAETLLPLGALVASALVGLVDDYWNVRKIGAHGGGLRVRHRLLVYALIALVGALWFFFKLEWTEFRVPFFGTFDIGWWYVPLFMLVIISTAFSVNETDGLDGLAGGVLLAAYCAYGAISFSQGRFDLAALCAVIVGALLAFLWFNIHPARFFMGDTGAMSLGVTLGIVAMLTNTALLLPIIGLPFVIEAASALSQIVSKKVLGKKIFISAPLHHHLEATGWSEPKIVMRTWIIAAVCAVVGVILALVD